MTKGENMYKINICVSKCQDVCVRIFKKSRKSGIADFA